MHKLVAIGLTAPVTDKKGQKKNTTWTKSLQKGGHIFGNKLAIIEKQMWQYMQFFFIGFLYIIYIH